MANRPRLQPSDFRPIARLSLYLLTGLAVLLSAPIALVVIWGRPPGDTRLGYGLNLAFTLLPLIAAIAGWSLHLARRERAAIAVTAPGILLALVMMAGFSRMMG